MRFTTLLTLIMFFFAPQVLAPIAAEAASARGKSFYGSLVVGSGFHNTFNFGRGFPSYLRDDSPITIRGTSFNRTLSGLSAASSSSRLSGYAHQPTNSGDITLTVGVDDPDVILHALTSSNLATRSITINGDIDSITPILRQAGIVVVGGSFNISGGGGISGGTSISQTGIVGGGGSVPSAVNNNPIPDDLDLGTFQLTSGGISQTGIVGGGGPTLFAVSNPIPDPEPITLTSTLTLNIPLGGLILSSGAASPAERVGKPGYVISIEAGTWVAPYLRVDMSIGYRSYKIKAEGVVTERTASTIPLMWNAAFYPMYLVDSNPNALSDFFITFGAGVGFWDAEDDPIALSGSFADNISGTLTTGAGYEYYIDNSASIGLEYEFAWSYIDASLGPTKEENVSHSILLIARYDF